jgi:hypothetical protein
MFEGSKFSGRGYFDAVYILFGLNILFFDLVMIWFVSVVGAVEVLGVTIGVVTRVGG